MTQPSDWRLPDGPERSAQHGEQPQPGQPQYEQPTPGQPPELPFYGPGPYPPTPFQPQKHSRGTLIVVLIGVLAIVGGGVAAVILLTGGNGGKKHAAWRVGAPANRTRLPNGRIALSRSNPPHRPRTVDGPGHDSPVRGTPAPGRPSASRRSRPPASPRRRPSPTGRPSSRDEPPQVPRVAKPSCARIQDVLNRTGAFDAGRIALSKRARPKGFGVPLPTGTAAATCTMHTARFSRFLHHRLAHVIVIAWRGTTERAYAAALTRAGYGWVGGRYRLWQGDIHHPRLPSLVTATIASRLVTFYRLG